MSTATSIQWTDATWNPLRGCTAVSPGCLNCYAMKQAHRFSGSGKAYEGLTKLTTKGPRWTGVVRTVPELLNEPFHWRKPRRVFVNSMSDLFHEDVPDSFIDEVFRVMVLTPHHTYQILTKRPERMAAYLSAFKPSPPEDGFITRGGVPHNRLPPGSVSFGPEEWPLRNVWLGTSVEDQARADERIPHLLRTPAAVRFLSVEPLLGPVDLRVAFNGWCPEHDFPGGFCTERDHEGVQHLHWVIVGGESGPGARPFNIAWAEQVLADCHFAGVPAFVKQLGAKPVAEVPGKEETRAVNQPFMGGGWSHWHLKDKKGGDPAEWPEHLRVREFPQVQP